jgi:type II secretory pathway pseudopilin PulG
MDFPNTNGFDDRVLSTSHMTPAQTKVPSRKVASGFFKTLFRVGVIIASILALIVVTITVAYHRYLSSQIRTRLAILQSAHKPITLAELNSYYPEVPAESNAAVIYQRAFDLLKRSDSFNSLEKLADLPKGTVLLPVQVRQSMEKACQDNASTLELLGEAARLRQCRYPVDYTPGWRALLPHLPVLSKCAALEMCDGVLQERKGDIGHAIKAIEVITSMAESLDTEPDLISVITQDKLYLQGSDLLLWLLNHNQLAPEQISDLQRTLRNAERTNNLERALAGEPCFLLATFNSSAAEILNQIDPGSEKRSGVVLSMYFLKISGRLKKDEIRFLDRIIECEGILSESLPDGLRLAENLRLGVQQEARKGAILTAMYFPAILKGIERNAERIAQQRLVQTALAIEQYRIIENRLPNSLAELTPKFLPNVPTDPFDDKEIQYRKEADGYAIYSIGPDRIDDGGKKQISHAAKIDHPRGDIVFAVSRKSDVKP